MIIKSKINFPNNLFINFDVGTLHLLLDNITYSFTLNYVAKIVWKEGKWEKSHEINLTKLIIKVGGKEKKIEVEDILIA